MLRFTEQKTDFSRQKVRSGSYTSFSVLGLTLTFCIGTLIIVLSLTVEPIFHLFQRWCGIGIYRRLEWISNETLQLHRMAHEGIGSGGTWLHATDCVPITEMHKLLAILDIENQHHPVLANALLSPPPEEMDDKLNLPSLQNHEGLIGSSV